jgi:hypothetical protein
VRLEGDAVLSGTNVRGFTAVDLSLAAIILFLLGAITARVLLSLYPRGGSARD